jgi:hypothetical protein
LFYLGRAEQGERITRERRKRDERQQNAMLAYVMTHVEASKISQSFAMVENNAMF